MSILKRDFLDKVKEREDCNHRNTLKYFEDYNLSVTQRLFKRAVSEWALNNKLKFHKVITGVSNVRKNNIAQVSQKSGQ